MLILTENYWVRCTYYLYDSVILCITMSYYIISINYWDTYGKLECVCVLYLFVPEKVIRINRLKHIIINRLVVKKLRCAVTVIYKKIMYSTKLSTI